MIALAVLVQTAATAQASDQIFWANFVTDKISHANIDGSGGVVDLNTTGATTDVPYGTAIDPVEGRVYWANSTGTKISWASLDGTGGGDLATGAATVSGPQGVSIDVAARKAYWLNDGGDKVSWANLDGSGGGDLDTGAAPIDPPGGLAVNPAAGKVYWTNWGFIGDGWISYANLDGSGGGKLPVSGANLETPFGIAIDAGAGRLYWVNDVPGVASSANLDGSGASDLDDRGLEINGPYGLALDPEAGKLYLANTVESESLAFLRTDGTGGATLPFEVANGSAPNFPALLFDPRPRGAPSVGRADIVLKAKVRKKGGGKRLSGKVVGVGLRCAPGKWAGDLVEAFLYRAPLSTSVQWTRDGSDIPGATSADFSTSSVGNYRCRESATNRAGSASQLSSVAAFFKVGGAKLNKRKGTAKLSVELPPGGRLTASSGGMVKRATEAAGKRTILIKPIGREKARLGDTGRATIKVTLNFKPAGGPVVGQSARVALKKRLPR